MAVCPIPAGGEVIKDGYRIGNAKEDIPAGAWIHTHNVGTALGDLLEYSYDPVAAVAEAQNAAEGAAAKGAAVKDSTEDVTFMAQCGTRHLLIFRILSSHFAPVCLTVSRLALWPHPV